MADHVRQAAAQLIMRELPMSEQEISARKQVAGVGPEDSRRVAMIKDIVVGRVEQYASAFFDYLAGVPEAKGLFQSRELLERARHLKKQHLVAMVKGDYGGEYIEQRLELAVLYSKVGLEPRVFLGALRHLLNEIGMAVMRQHNGAPLEAFEAFMSLEKIAFLDVSIIVDVLVFERERLIRQQQDAIRELSTPVLQIRDRMLLLPIIGVLDTHRARLLTESLLHAIRANRAKVVVMDVTGVVAIDSKVANHLLQTVTAARLMGANVVVTGLSSDVAQSLVALGIDLGRLNTVGDLQGGLEEAELLLAHRTVSPALEPSAEPTL